jgi:Mn2+/Fe2+ NRAMP family transporter
MPHVGCKQLHVCDKGPCVYDASACACYALLSCCSSKRCCAVYGNASLAILLIPAAAVTAAAGPAVQIKMKPVMRRLLTRALAVIPAVIVAAVMGDKAVGQLLVISQVSRLAPSYA